MRPTLIYNIGQLVTMKKVVDKDGIGVTEEDLSIVEDAELYFENGVVRFAGPKDMIAGVKPEVFVNANAGVVLPAFVDPHTHAVFAGSRHNEFAMRASGKTYLEIAQEGGGINASTEAIAEATVDQLAALGKERIELLHKHGVGAVEIKSGYGLSPTTEIKMLEAIEKIAAESPGPVVATFLGAHAIPKSYKYDPEAYVDQIVERMLPEVAEKKLAVFCDVFVEEGFFSVEQGRRILTKAAELGLKPKLHADEFESLGGAQLAAELGAVSADHLLAVDDPGIKALAEAGVTAVLLPGTSLFLGGEKYAPARKMLDQGVRVALATDLNPGSSYTENYLLILTLACAALKMTVPETLAAATYNAAKAIGYENACGSIMPGRLANVAMFNVPHYEAIPYHMAVSDMTDLWVGGEHVIGDAGIDAKDIPKLEEETQEEK
jgi:imidazolonepropionase